MIRDPRLRDVLAVGGAVAAAFLYVWSPLPTLQTNRPHHVVDVYALSFPNFLYARQALERGWGLLWNDFQNCGQPFFGIIYTALLYPVNFPFLWGDATRALLFQAAANLAIGGAGMYFLCRELTLGRYASLLGALGFELGGITAKLTFWAPFTIAPWAWLPAALFLCERVLRRPTPGAGVALGVCLTLQLLAGFPQIQIFTVQLIVLRTLWEFATRPGAARLRAAFCLALGLVLPALLGAVQLLPAMEVARESVRNRALALQEASPWEWNWSVFRRWVDQRQLGSGTLFQVAPVALAGFAVFHRRERRRLGFYCVAAVLFFALSFEPFLMYRAIPVLGSFRMPDRFLWLTGFAFAVVGAFGIDAVTRQQKVTGTGRGLAVGAPLLAILAFYAVSPSGFEAWEWTVAGAVLLIGFCLLWGHVPRLGRAAIFALLLGSLYALSLPPAQPYTDTEAASLFRHSSAFNYVADHASAEDRMYQIGPPGGFGVMPRSASLYGIPSILDYELQTSARYAAFLVRMMLGRQLDTLNDFVYLQPSAPKDRALFDLVATRYVVAAEPSPEGIRALGVAPGQPGRGRPVFREGKVRVYRNPSALPRVVFVPQAAVVSDPEQVLRTLASATHDPRALALVEERPADGFLGDSPGAEGEARIERSRGEELVVRVSASAAGFLFVSDQFYPGWEATVNGAPTPISRANYAFRLVRVPQGESEVVFRYRPSSVRIGAVVSLSTLLGLIGWATVRLLRRHGSPAVPRRCPAPVTGPQ